MIYTFVAVVLITHIFIIKYSWCFHAHHIIKAVLYIFAFNNENKKAKEALEKCQLCKRVCRKVWRGTRIQKKSGTVICWINWNFILFCCNHWNYVHKHSSNQFLLFCVTNATCHCSIVSGSFAVHTLFDLFLIQLKPLPRTKQSVCNCVPPPENILELCAMFHFVVCPFAPY